MKIIGRKQPNETPISEIEGGQIFKHRASYYLAGQGGPMLKRDCILLETGKNIQLSNNTCVEVFPDATLYLEGA